MGLDSKGLIRWGLLKMTSKTMMRADKDLLKELAKCKLVKAESYADVVKRLIDKERKK